MSIAVIVPDRVRTSAEALGPVDPSLVSTVTLANLLYEAPWNANEGPKRGAQKASDTARKATQAFQQRQAQREAEAAKCGCAVM